MSRHLAQAKVLRALKHNSLPAANFTYQPGDKVLVWREKQIENRIGTWLGPYTAVTVDDSAKIVVVKKNASSAEERYSTTQVKPFISPQNSAISFIDTIHKTLHSYASAPSDTSLKRFTGIRSSDILATEIIEPGDPRASSSEMRKAILSEVRDLLKRETFKVVLKEELPDGANTLTARFVLGIKSNADGQIKYKARYVIGGHRDKLKHYMVHGAQTVQPSSIRLLLALASSMNFEVWSSDVKLAYLQSTEPLERRVFIREPDPEFELEPHECFELLKPLYGLCDAGDLWHLTLRKHLVDEVRLIPTKSDPSLSFFFSNGELTGINGSYVDDLLRAGNKNFRDTCQITHERF